MKPKSDKSGEILVEVVEGKATPEQKNALRRFRQWYKAKLISDFADKGDASRAS